MAANNTNTQMSASELQRFQAYLYDDMSYQFDDVWVEEGNTNIFFSSLLYNVLCSMTQRSQQQQHAS